MSEIIPASLSSKERKRYEICKEKINTALEQRFEGGLALREVRDDRLYREEYSSFEEFCKAAYNLSRRYVDYMIEAAEVKADIDSRSPEAAELLTNERQTRALAEVPRGQQVKVLKELQKAGEPITAEAITAKAESISKETPDSIDRKARTVVLTPSEKAAATEPIQLDETGFKLTETAAKSWAHRDRVQGWLSAITKIKSEFKALEMDPLFIRQRQQIEANLIKCYSVISECKPYAVCTDCSGHPTKNGKFCTYCGTSGVISKYNYDLQSRSSVKEIREKAGKRA